MSDAYAAPPPGGPDPNPPLPPPVPPPRPPLRRSTSDRVLGGVCAGVARTLGVDPVIIRVLVAVLTVLGGAGVVLYVIGLLVIPEDGAQQSEGQRLLSGRANATTITWLAIGAAVLVLLAFGGTFGPWGFGWGGPHLGGPLIGLAVIGLVVYLLSRRSGPAAAAPSVDPGPTTPQGYAYGWTGTYRPTLPDAPPVTDTDPVQTGGAPTVSEAVPPLVLPPTAGPPPVLPPTAGPTPAGSPRPVRREPSYLGLATLSLAVVVAGILVLLDRSGALAVPAGVVLAASLGVLGLGLLVGAVVGRARWLVWLAAPLALLTACAVALPTGVRFGDGIGQRTWRPTTVAQVEQEYSLGIGNATLDLAALPADATGQLRVTARQGIGRLLVIVPNDARVEIDAEVGAGVLTVPGESERNGSGLEVTTTVDPVVTPPATPPASTSVTPLTIDLDATLGAGNLEVRREAS
ncbi:MAG: PspC domain-containing protein [Actinomycetota bacterium]|nr:MAG: PspC domain-containing protein [Actinomycetota bacterium]